MMTRNSNGRGKGLSPRRWLRATAVGVALVAIAAGSAGPAAAASAWTPTGFMTAPRANGQTATLLNSGKVLVAGGLRQRHECPVGRPL